MKFTLLLAALFATSAFARKSDDNLFRTDASVRKSQVKSVDYKLEFELQKDAPGYKGRVQINAELLRTDQDLSIDALLTKIESIQINGKPVKSYPKRTGSFDIPKSSLSKNNRIEITFSNDYSKESAGFQRVKDPEDGSEYVYTDFEPYQAHKFFPCFDQPDLKAIYQVKVKAPSDWKVIHNELVDTATTEGEWTVTNFKSTPPLSTYLFFLGAGPFVEWKEHYETTPIYLYARKSLAQFVDHEAIMKTTAAGLRFYNDYFGYKYPFSKYGQIFIPEFAWGGMENPGAITLNERNIFRGPVPNSKLEDRDNLILHEMAHMWFGDLVTMEWWNDLWLNESFATYLASIAQERALDSKATWMDFFGTKAWGYWQDQLVTSHPIETEVPDVRTARGNFDGITYAKGASALKQLHFFVGEKGFQEGLKAYFKNNAFKNTQRKDFIGSIATASGVNLDAWTEKWLQTAGPNRVKVKFSCEKGDIQAATVEQSPSVSGNLSPHRARFGLYELDGKKLDQEKVTEVLYTSASTEIPDLKGEDCPDFILPNQDDMDYALFSLDEKSVTHAEEALTTLPDSLSRFMVWNILGQMLRDQELKSSEFFRLAGKALTLEQDDLLLGLLLGRHSSLRDQYFLYLTKEERASLAPDFESVLWKRITESKEGSSIQMTFFDFYVSVAQTADAQKRLAEMLTKNAPPKGIVIDQDRRWAIIQTLAKNGYKDALALSSEELKKDRSTLGKRMDLVAQASFPDKKLKEKMWKMFLTNKDLTYSSFKEAGDKFHGTNTPELSQPYVNAFFHKVSTIDWSKNDSVVDIYFEKLFPFNLCSKPLADLSSQKLKAAKNLTNLAKRSWLESQDELERCVKVRAKNAGSPAVF